MREIEIYCSNRSTLTAAQIERVRSVAMQVYKHPILKYCFSPPTRKPAVSCFHLHYKNLFTFSNVVQGMNLFNSMQCTTSDFVLYS